jgi:hypothetical protein
MDSFTVHGAVERPPHFALAAVLAIAVAIVLKNLTHHPSPSRHFDRSCSRFCEQRSGETRFSTSTASRPRLQLLLLSLLLLWSLLLWLFLQLP